MSLRQLIEGDCGGVNPLMQFGGQLTRDAVHKDDGIQAQLEYSSRQEDQMVNEFLGQVSGPPQSFQMETLLQEMHEIEKSTLNVNQQLHAAPRVIDEIAVQWSQEFNDKGPSAMLTNANREIIYMKPQQQQYTQVREFFEELNEGQEMLKLGGQQPFLPISPPFKPLSILHSDIIVPTIHTETFFEEAQTSGQTNDWVTDYEVSNKENERATVDFNEKFWQDLQNKWTKLSSDNLQYPWLPDFEENYDYFKEYKFCEENPMQNITNALEEGKKYLSNGDIPSAVLCFEEAVKQEPDNAKAWEFLGITQAENEMDPQAIAALQRSLQLDAENPSVIMALSVCYTNENLPLHALKMLSHWLKAHPKYKYVVPSNILEEDANKKDEASNVFVSSVIHDNKLEELQNLYLQVVRLNPNEIDADIQEALGVLYNLSSDYDKAADCFRAALNVEPQNAKLWNRLGASLANGSRSVEAVDAYQNALKIEPGFIRARYNVGVCCLNLKAYKEAAEHLITALNLQANATAKRKFREETTTVTARGEQQMSESIWSTLKMILSLMGRNDLQQFVNDRNITALNEAFPN